MVAYDPHSANQIYIRPNNSYDQYWTADLSQRSREYRDYTIWDVWGKK